MICETALCLRWLTLLPRLSNRAFLTSKHAFHMPCQLCILQAWVLDVVTGLESSIAPNRHCYLHVLMPFYVQNC